METAQDEPEKVTGWRLSVLLNAGYPQADAEKLAALPGVDLHRAVDLVAEGCEPSLAAEILA